MTVLQLLRQTGMKFIDCEIRQNGSIYNQSKMINKHLYENSCLNLEVKSWRIYDKPTGKINFSKFNQKTLTMGVQETKRILIIEIK